MSIQLALPYAGPVAFIAGLDSFRVECHALYTTIIANGWVTELSHAAYLGKELAKAELSLKHDLKYVQDGA